MLVAVVMLATLYGRIEANANAQPLAGVAVDICSTRALPGRAPGYTCSSRYFHAMTDRNGRFVVQSLRRGWYIYELSSNDVPRVESLLQFDPTHPHRVIHTCSRTFDRACLRSFMPAWKR